MSAAADKPDEAVHEVLQEVLQEQPRRSRDDILRQFKLALAIGDGSLLELDQDRARGVNPYDSGLGGRRPASDGRPQRRR
jgi:hypothetical protein